MGDILRKIASLSVALKVVLGMAVLIALGLAVVLSPFLAVLASLVLVVAVIALVIQLFRRGSLRRWGIVAAASLVLVLLFSEISNALYGSGGQPNRRKSSENLRHPRRRRSNPQSRPRSRRGMSPSSRLQPRRRIRMKSPHPNLGPSKSLPRNPSVERLLPRAPRRRWPNSARWSLSPAWWTATP